MARLILELLGPFSARIEPGAEALHFPTRKSEALLAYLATTPGRHHSRDKLASLLWGYSENEQAKQSLRQTLFGIRKRLGDDAEDVIIATDDKLSINADLVEVDLPLFEHRIAEATLPSFEEAAKLYKGDFLVGMDFGEETFDNWVVAERARLHELALNALTTLMDLQARDGRATDAILTGVRTLALNPLQESAHRTLMQLYIAQGRTDAAIKQYRACVEVMRRQLHIEPQAETRRLYERILQARESGDTLEVREDSLTRPLSVLLVEDNALHRSLVRSMLLAPRFQLAMADDGAQALLEIGRNEFDLILLDINLPTLDGLTLLEAIRKSKIDTPIIVLTGQPGEEHEVRGLKLGADDFLHKPVRQEVLLARIEKVIRDRREMDRVR